MKKYLRLLRLQDQYLQSGSALAAGIYLNKFNLQIIFWAIACTLLSFTAAILNELTDSQDSDKYSWNKVHTLPSDKYNPLIVRGLFLIFSLCGLFLAYLTQTLIWGIAIYVIGLLYSLKPMRLKNLFVLDIIAQILVWWVLPFWAVVHFYGYPLNYFPFLLSIIFINWSVFYPYQLADFEADRKAGLRSTHLILGMRKSLIFGLSIGILGILINFYYNFYLSYPWLNIFLIFQVYTLSGYLRWLKLPTLISQTLAMQKYVQKVKPYSQFLLPYLIIFWINNFPK